MQPPPPPGAVSPPAPCRLCGVWFAGDQSFCPKCGLIRDGEQAYPAPAYPAAMAAPPAYAPPYPPAYPSAGFPGYSPPPGSAGYPGYPGSPGPFGYPGYPGYPGYASESQPSSRRRPVLWVILGAVVLVLAVGAGLLVALNPGGKANAASTVTVPDGNGVIYRSTKGHFAARFPELPDEKVVRGNVEGLSYTLILATDPEAHIVVESANFSRAIPSSRVAGELTSAIKSTGSSPNITLVSETATVFQGHQAHLGSYKLSDGTLLTAVAFSYTSKRIYELIAPTGSAYDNLIATFVAVP